MDEIQPKIQGVRMISQDNGTHHLILITLNAMWADILHHTLGNQVVLGYTYDGSDITCYLVFELVHIDKLFRVAINASGETLKWLNWIDQKMVTDIWAAHLDGKGGIVPFGQSISLQ
ncbi:MAG: hypothetical protein JWP78_248 [Mucilaginibacter sp.]|nr:hypothetical protein [Mucilaginibacter sp.]